MRKEDIDPELRRLVFDFFYWFSRFEFALKENRFLENATVGAPAKPNWNRFVSQRRDDYVLTPAGRALIDAKPRRQVVGENEHDFEERSIPANTADLDRVVAYAKTVRNNLFHGGKHGPTYWDEPKRTKLLLESTIEVLHELAELADFKSDFDGYH